ncbi:MAG: IS66 family insertion sequence element accessory protein TnpB [Proteobacteria bacterium]|nr:IS66 family insertion sequence element accessory protein TnpB [Pseudomonadota bacterium]
MNKRSATEWQALFEEQASSGQSAAAFCREHQLCPKYFSLRRKQLGRPPVKIKQPKNERLAASSAFVPATVTPRLSSPELMLQMGELRLTLPPTVDSHWLANVLKVLQD